jgi:hypothetical protein
MNKETIIKNAAIEMYQQLRHTIQGDAELARKISEAFEMNLLSGDPDAEHLLRARTAALIELSRLDAIQAQKEIVLASVVTGLKIVRAVLISL